MRSRTEASAGGVVYRVRDGDVEICLAARRTRRGDLAWGLPKGLIEPDEEAEKTAVREVLEETGLEAEIEADLGTIRYFYVWEGVRVRKQVRFFLMRATGGDVANHDHEMEDVRWFAARSAAKRASYRGEREVLERGVGLLSWPLRRRSPACSSASRRGSCRACSGSAAAS
jgi:8-oxo-dGTP pyrophosphatase MutT (NUDIX family)